MKVFKKFLVVFVFIFALAAIVGCGKKEETETKENPTPVQETTNNPVPSGKTEEPTVTEPTVPVTQPHEHVWSSWTVKTAPTCESDGVEERTCECGESETRTVAKLGHDLKFVAMVPATLTTLGVSEHYECNTCHKLFDESQKEVELTSLQFEGIVADYVSDPIVGTLNSYSEVQIYDGNAKEIYKDDIDGYVFGIDASGKIIYASHYGGGYGGPSDGFYHDGTYSWEVGKICGIFNIYPEFQVWPNTTTYNGQETNAWTLYDVVVPEGGYLISLKRDKAVDFVKALTGFDISNEESNTVFETNVADGLLNDVKVSVVKGTKNAYFVAYYEPTFVSTLNKASSVTIYNDKSNLTKDDIDDCYVLAILDGKLIYASHFGGDGYGGPSDGFYHDGTYAWEAGKVCGIFDIDSNFAPWPATATVNGNTVNAWTLFDVKVPEGGYIIAGKFDDIKDIIVQVFGDSSFYNETSNVFFENTADGTYNDSLGFRVVEGVESAAVYAETYKTGLEYIGSNQSGSFVLQEDGTYLATITFGVWNNVSFKWYGAKGSVTELWYDNTTFTGDVTDSETVGAVWDHRLYHEDSKKLYSSTNRDMTYDFVYNPETHEMNIKCHPVQETEITISGDAEGKFAVVSGTDNLLSAQVTLNQWNSIQFKLTNAYGFTSTLWYDNTTFTGKVTSSETIGADWTVNLYHDVDESGKTDYKFYTCVEGPTTYVFSYDLESKTMSVSVLYDEYFAYSGSINGEDVDNKLDSASGTLVLQLGIWNSIKFYKFNSDGTTTTLFFDNATITGEVTDKDTYGADWTTKLYHEQNDDKFICSVSSNPTYKFSYDFDNKTLDIKLLTEPVLSIGGSVSQVLVAGEDGNFSTVVTLAQWEKINLTYTDNEGNATIVWYDNTTFTGSVTSSEYSGADWTSNLYHEGESKDLYCCVNKCSYELTYNKENNTLNVIALVDEAVTATVGENSLTFDYADGVFSGVVALGEWGNVTLTYNNKYNEKTVIFFDNTTITGDVTVASYYGCDWTTNLYHEDGGTKFYAWKANKYLFTYNLSEKTLTIELLVDPYMNATVGENVIDFTEKDGVFSGVVALGEWGNVTLVYSNEHGQTTTVFFDNTTITGDVTVASYYGCDWTTNLYHEDGGTKFYAWKANKYLFTYNPTLKTLTIKLLSDSVLSYYGNFDGNDASGTFTDNGDGTFTAVVEIPQWKHIGFTYTDELGVATVIFFDNTTITGTVTDSETYGCAWTSDLYHEQDEKFLYSYVDNTSYQFVYDSIAKTMVISIYVPEAVDSGNYYVLSGETKLAISSDITIYDSDDTNITLGEYSIAVDGSGKVFFASRTSGGYGGPSDGFYHDGTYAWEAGKVCGIFDIDSNFAPWPAKVTIDGSEVNAWTLYSITCPENCHIITGSQSAISNLVKALCNIDTFTESNNTLFENTMAKGSITTTVGFEFND